MTEPTPASPTVRARQLGMELRRLREAAEMTQNQVATWLNVDQTAVSKWEKGDRSPNVGNVKALAQLFHIDTDHADHLEKLAREAGQRGWWVEYGATVPPWFLSYLGMETAAAETWLYAAEAVPGLLQTEEYMTAVTSDPEARRLRTARQRRLHADSPLVLRVILNEAVLHRHVAGPQGMRAQIEHLLTVGALPNVSIQVLPFSAENHPAMMTGSFATLRFPDEPTMPRMDTVYVEFQGGAVYLEKPQEVARHEQIFERLAELALDEEGTTLFLGRMARRYMSGGPK